jgi:hypothetical protein
LVDYIPMTQKSGNLRGLCPTCDRYVHRRVSRSNLNSVLGQLEVTFTVAPLRIRDGVDPSVNCGFELMVAK